MNRNDTLEKELRLADQQFGLAHSSDPSDRSNQLANQVGKLRQRRRKRRTAITGAVVMTGLLACVAVLNTRGNQFPNPDDVARLPPAVKQAGPEMPAAEEYQMVMAELMQRLSDFRRDAVEGRQLELDLRDLRQKRERLNVLVRKVRENRLNSLRGLMSQAFFENETGETIKLTF